VTTTPNGARSRGVWTIEAYVAHNEALRTAEEKFQAERDRRYAEVQIEREKALRIKERGDTAALLLAREIQTYKDMKANELREQISSERGLYATKPDLVTLSDKFAAAVKPLDDYVSVARGRGFGAQDNRTLIAWAITVIASLLAIGSFVLNRADEAVPPQQPMYIYTPALPGTLLPQPSPPQPQQPVK